MHIEKQHFSQFLMFYLHARMMTPYSIALRTFFITRSTDLQTGINTFTRTGGGGGGGGGG